MQDLPKPLVPHPGFLTTEHLWSEWKRERKKEIKKKERKKVRKLER